MTPILLPRFPSLGRATLLVGAALLMALGGAMTWRALRSRGEPDPPPAIERGPDSATVWVDFHLRHTRKDPPVRFFRRDGNQPALVLTYDCAWVDEAPALELLDFLRDHGLRATFFVSGVFLFADHRRAAAGFRDSALRLIRRMVEDGHEFGSHTVNHPRLADTVDWEQENRELGAAWDAAVRLAFDGRSPPPNARMLPFWRAPFGEYDRRSLAQASRAGFPVQIGWSIDVHDALGLPPCPPDAPPDQRCLDPGRMTDRIIQYADTSTRTLDAVVVLAHLQNPYRWTLRPDGLSRLVDWAASRGFVVRPLSAVFEWGLAPDVGRPAGDPADQGGSTPTMGEGWRRDRR